MAFAEAILESTSKYVGSHGQVVVRDHMEGIQHLIQQLPMLSDDEGGNIQIFPCFQLLTNGQILIASGLAPKTSMIFLYHMLPYFFFLRA